MMGLWLMMVSFVFRIQFSFEKHPYLAYSPLVIKVLHLMLLLELAMVILVFLLDDFAWEVAVGYLTLSFQFVFSVVLSYSLFSKIFKVMRHRLDTRLAQTATTQESVAKDSVAKDSVAKHSPNQISLSSIKMVTRFALLMFMGIISTYLCCTVFILDIELGLSSSSNVFIVGSIFGAIDLLINSIAVFLLFQHSTATYHALCGRFHRICEIMCVEMIYRSSKKEDRDGGGLANVQHRNDFSDLILKDEFKSAPHTELPTQASAVTSATQE